MQGHTHNLLNQSVAAGYRNGAKQGNGGSEHGDGEKVGSPRVFGRFKKKFKRRQLLDRFGRSFLQANNACDHISVANMATGQK